MGACFFIGQILEADAENGSMHYLVHYSGWNNRYDEWVMKDRIVGLVELVEPSKAPPIKPKASKFKHVSSAFSASAADNAVVTLCTMLCCETD